MILLKTKEMCTQNIKFKKTAVLAFISIIGIAKLNSQSQNWWRIDGNNSNTSEFVGTTNAVDFVFKTSNQTRFIITANGTLKVINFAGSGNRLITTDANGNLAAFPQGNANQVLFGNGTWGAIPTQTVAGVWGINGNKYFYNGGNVGVGTNNPQFLLDVAGDARIQNNLYINGGLVLTDRLNAAESVTTGVLNADTIQLGGTRVLAGDANFLEDVTIASNHTLTANGDVRANSKLTVQGNALFNGILKVSNLGGSGFSKVYSNSQGELFKGPSLPTSWECESATPNWNLGGNNFSGLNVSFPNVLDANIGTCDNFDFILKSNNVHAQFIKPNGSIGFGANFITGPSDPVIFRFANGPVMASGNSVYGGPMYMFFGPTSPNGDWGVEYTGGTSAPHAGLNFWKPFGSANGNNNILFLNDNNRIGIGTDNPSARLTIDAWSDDGLLILTDPNKNVIDVKDKSTYKVNFRVKSTGEVFARRVKVMVSSATFPDYVFDDKYKVMSLYDIEKYYKKYKHLPEIPTAEFVEKNDMDLGEMNKLLLKKIEEMTILMVEMKKEIDALKTNK